MADVQHAMGPSLLAECPDTGRNRRCAFSKSLPIPFAECLSHRVHHRRGWPIKRFGFAYGTLAEHAESGEERFTVEWHGEDDTVWYDVLAFSRPRQVLARLGYPLSRLLQKRFAEGSKATMLQAARDVHAKSSRL
jgi:hypothetical protein